MFARNPRGSSSKKKVNEKEAQEITKYPWGDLYDLMVVQFKIPPSEYWKMTPKEVGRHLEQNRPKDINGIHEDDYAHLLKRREELKAQGVKLL